MPFGEFTDCNSALRCLCSGSTNGLGVGRGRDDRAGNSGHPPAGGQCGKD